MIHSITEIQELWDYLSLEERNDILRVLMDDRAIWRPLPGPQSMAYYAQVDVLGFGGSAGGGKTDLLIGKALTQHQVSAFFRREGTEMTAIEDRLRDIIGNDIGYNGTKRIWRRPVKGVKQIEFGSVPNIGDEKKYQGRPKDLLGLDEAVNFAWMQARFLMGWVRTVDPRQHCETVLTFNPPTTQDGRWIVEFFAPWLDRRKYPDAATPGEVRYFVRIDDADVEVPDSRSLVLGKNNELRYDFDRHAVRLDRILRPQSRTFIPSRVTDNPFLVGTDYMTTLQALPEPLRSQMLYGDFEAGMGEDPWQVCPSAWVDAAMARWKKRDAKPPMDSLGVDVARGGKDNTIIARRHRDMWFDEPLVYAGKETPDGPLTAGLVLAARRNEAPIHIDVIGIGSSPYDFLRSVPVQVIGVIANEKAHGTDRSGRLEFADFKSMLWWRMREALDPANNVGIALPPDKRLRADLCAPRWRPQGRLIWVEGREELTKADRLGRSADWGAAYVMALMDTPRITDLARKDTSAKGHDPYAIFGGEVSRGGGGHNPYDSL